MSFTDEDNVVRIEDVKCLRQTDKAILVEVEGEQKWIPQSVIHDDSEVYKKDTEGVLIVSKWFAEKEGLT